MSHIPHHTFRAYDIRGIAETEITPVFCRLVGRGFGSELRQRYKKDHPTVIVGRDARTHGPTLEAALIEGLVQSGCTVKTIGQTPSPVNYFALCHTKCDGSVQITASHNPKEDNGLKLQVRNAEAFSGDNLQELRKRIEEERFEDCEGSTEELDAITPYLEKMQAIGRAVAQNDVRNGEALLRPYIVADFGNGVAGPVYEQALIDAGFEVISLYKEPDGTFPNHPADPSKYETLTELMATVKEKKAICGIAFDGDGDRVGFVDENGNVVSPDYLLLLLAEDHLKRFPHFPIVYTVSMSSILQTEVERMGGKPIMCEVGHSFVEHTMQKHGSHLGGEQSGHFFCGEDYYDFDDALVAALRVLSIYNEPPPNPLHSMEGGCRCICSSTNKTQTSPLHNVERARERNFSHLFTNYPRIYQTPELRPRCPDDKKTEIVQKITDHFVSEGFPCVTIDGVRIDFEDGAWASVRQSNTSPKLSICIEARSKEKLEEIEKIVRKHLDGYSDIKI